MKLYKIPLLACIITILVAFPVSGHTIINVI